MIRGPERARRLSGVALLAAMTIIGGSRPASADIWDVWGSIQRFYESWLPTFKARPPGPTVPNPVLDQPSAQPGPAPNVKPPPSFFTGPSSPPPPIVSKPGATTSGNIDPFTGQPIPQAAAPNTPPAPPQVQSGLPPPGQLHPDAGTCTFNSPSCSGYPPSAPAGVPKAPSQQNVPSAPVQRPSLLVPQSGGTYQSSPPTGAGVVPRPGGISLSHAAAKGMALGISIDAAYSTEDRIVLLGRETGRGIDAALFLTTLRAACEDEDPYFSLDPDDGALWYTQGQGAFDTLWKRVQHDFEPGVTIGRGEKTQSPVDIGTVSATRKYPGLWREIAPGYPNFRTKLVFHPEWLRQTRFGEILYKADVLLKELASGVSVLVPGQLRAASIDGYLAADAERAGKGLLSAAYGEVQQKTKLIGSRLWFDIVPSAPPDGLAAVLPSTRLTGDARLVSILKERGLIRAHDDAPGPPITVTTEGNAIDVSLVNPRMFVRAHNLATHQDLADHDPDLDGLANDVSKRFSQYAEAYDELRLLRDVFRSYIVAVQITSKNDGLCERLGTLPLLDAEKVATSLTDYRPSELFITAATYKTATKRSRKTLLVMASSMSGGVTIAARQLLEIGVRAGRTPLTNLVTIRAEGATSFADEPADPARRFISLDLDGALSARVRLAANVRPVGSPKIGQRASGGLYEGEIENEPPAQKLPTWSEAKGLGWIMISLLLVVALAVVGRSGKRRSVQSYRR
jgi:hypothetical protein